MRRLKPILAVIHAAWPDRPTGHCWYCGQPVCGCNAVVVAKPEGFAGVCLPCFEERSFNQLEDLPFHLVGTPVCDHGWAARTRRLRRLAAAARRHPSGHAAG